MQILKHDGIALHYRDEGTASGPALVFSNSLGTDFRLWDKILPLLPAGLRIIRYDKRGHGLSGAPPPPYFMADLVGDAAALLDHLNVKDCVFVGISIGGMIAQGLAASRPELMCAMVLSNTGASIGTPKMWDERIDAVARNGIEALADPIMQRWFSPAFRQRDELAGWRNMLVRQTVPGYVGCCAAISGCDLSVSTAALTLPTLGIAGSEDGSTPPELVRKTTALVAGSRFHLVRGAGHLPCIEKPGEYAEVLSEFLKEVGHV
ncbi:MAG: 3-oxoadipate enol-lactonase [Paracoccaceae bacterium]